MKRLQVIDIVAIACEVWNCDASTALDRLDLGTIELAVAAAFGAPDPVEALAGEQPESTPSDDDVDGIDGVDDASGVTAVDELAGAAARLVAHLLPAKAAGTDTRRHTLLVAVCLASINGYRLTAEAEELVDTFDQVVGGRIDEADLRRWFAARLTPTEQPVSMPGPSGRSEPSELSPMARRVLALARNESERFGHAMIGTEHVLLGILLTGPNEATDLLNSEGATHDAVRREIVLLVGSGYTPANRVRPLTPRAREVLERARVNATVDNATGTVEGWHLLQAITTEGQGLAAKILARLGNVVESTELWSEPARLRRRVAMKLQALQARQQSQEQAAKRMQQAEELEKARRLREEELGELIRQRLPDAARTARDPGPTGPTPIFTVVRDPSGDDNPWLAEEIRKFVQPLAPGALVAIRERRTTGSWHFEVTLTAQRQAGHLDRVLGINVHRIVKAMTSGDAAVEVRTVFTNDRPTPPTKLTGDSGTSTRKTQTVCTFCRRAGDGVALVAAPRGAICNLCLSAALAAIDDDLHRDPTQKFRFG